MRKFPVVLVVALSVACASNSAPRTDADRSEAPAAQGGDANILVAAEIAQSGAFTLYDAIQKLRANFLTNRGSVTIKTDASPLPVVFRDGAYYGDMNSLKNIQAGEVESARMYRAWEATTKFGSSYTAGVISVTTKR